MKNANNVAISHVTSRVESQSILIFVSFVPKAVVELINVNYETNSFYSDPNCYIMALVTRATSMRWFYSDANQNPSHIRLAFRASIRT